MVTNEDKKLVRTLIGNYIVKDSEIASRTNIVVYKAENINMSRWYGSSFPNVRFMFEWFLAKFSYLKQFDGTIKLHTHYGLNIDNPLLEQLWEILIEERLREIQ